LHPSFGRSSKRAPKRSAYPCLPAGHEKIGSGGSVLVTKADSFCRELSTWDVGDSRSLTPWPLSQRANGAPRVPAPFRFSDCSYSAVGSGLLPTSVAYFEFHSGPNLFYVVAGFDHNQHEGDTSENSCSSCV